MVPIAQRRPCRNRSSNGPTSGAITVNGAIVISRNRATWPRASPLGMPKIVPTSESVNAVSAAVLTAFSSTNRASPDSPAPPECVKILNRRALARPPRASSEHLRDRNEPRYGRLPRCSGRHPLRLAQRQCALIGPSRRLSTSEGLGLRSRVDTAALRPRALVHAPILPRPGEGCPRFARAAGTSCEPKVPRAHPQPGCQDNGRAGCDRWATRRPPPWP